MNARVGFAWCQRVISRYIKYQEPAQAPVASHLTMRSHPDVGTGKAYQAWGIGGHASTVPVRMTQSSPSGLLARS